MSTKAGDGDVFDWEFAPSDAVAPIPFDGVNLTPTWIDVHHEADVTTVPPVGLPPRGVEHEVACLGLTHKPTGFTHRPFQVGDRSNGVGSTRRRFYVAGEWGADRTKQPSNEVGAPRLVSTPGVDVDVRA